MANEEYLARLRQDIQTWNKWLMKWTDIHPDLRDADLIGADLKNADLTNVDLSGANLHKANLYGAQLGAARLRGADLSNANLLGAYLRGTDLHSADLHSADLSYANLSEALMRWADLSEADLRITNLERANLQGANLAKARMGPTFFGDRDFREIKGLETIEHIGPSPLSVNSIYLSQGNIPEVFVRGTGAPDTFIEYMRSLVTQPIGFYTCFISYSNRDKSFTTRLHTDLQSKSVRCWFAPEDLKIGDHYHQRIDESIRLYDKLILILSEHAIQSAWVEREVVAAREKEDHLGREILFPIRLDEAVMQTTKAWAADVRRRWYIGDFTQWKHHDAYQQAFERLLRDLMVEEKF